MPSWLLGVFFSSVSVYNGFGLRNKLRDGPLHNEKARGIFFLGPTQITNKNPSKRGPHFAAHWKWPTSFCPFGRRIRTQQDGLEAAYEWNTQSRWDGTGWQYVRTNRTLVHPCPWASTTQETPRLVEVEVRLQQHVSQP